MTKEELFLEFQSVQVRFGPTEVKTFYDVPVSFSEKRIHIVHPEYKYRIHVRKATKMDISVENHHLKFRYEQRDFSFVSNPLDKHQFSEFARRVKSCYEKGHNASVQQFESFLESTSSRGRQQLHRGKQRRVFGKKSSSAPRSLLQYHNPVQSKPRYQEHFSDDEVEDEGQNKKIPMDTTGTSEQDAPTAAFNGRNQEQNPSVLNDDHDENVTEQGDKELADESGTDDELNVTFRPKNRIGRRLTKAKNVLDDDDDESSDDDFLHRPLNLTTPAVQRVVSPSMSKRVMEDNQQEDAVDKNQRSITSFFRPKKPATYSSETTAAVKLSSPSPATTPSRLPASAARLVKSAKSTIRQETWLSTSPARFSSSETRKQGLFGSSYASATKRHPLELLDRDDPIVSTPPQNTLNVHRVLKRPRLQSYNLQHRWSDLREHARQLPITPMIGQAVSDIDDRPVSRFRGIQNLGNTCYASASLQMLCSAFDFIKAIKGRGGRLTHSLVKVAQELQEEMPFSPVDPRDVKEAMDARTDRFAGNEQRDAHEFMGELVDAIHDELEEERKNSSTTSEEKDRLPTDDFRMTVHKVLKCESCGYNRTMNEMYRYLSIDIINGDATDGDSFNSDQKPSVEKGLSHYFQPDVRELKCEKCSDGIHATETLFVSERPRFLLLHLKRFMWVERPQSVAPMETGENLPPNGPAPAVEYVFQKNKAAVSIPESLVLDPFCKENDISLVGSSRYRLKSIVHHIGQRPSSGHYISDAIRPCKDDGSENRPHPVPNTEERPPEVIQETSALQLPSNETDKPRAKSVAPTETHKSPIDSYQWVAFDDTNTAIVDLDRILRSKNRQSTAYMLLYALEDQSAAS